MSKTIYSKEYKQVVTALKKARIDASLTQTEVAKKLSKPQSYISKSELGERRLDVTELKKFADLYKKSLNYFIKQ
ncbi:helix-turn-helix domain-containing protein [Patescibacteria group bacterium]|nr:helix-turn-helix domain-containing protein [Patescibacteria group bacterium]